MISSSLWILSPTPGQFMWVDANNTINNVCNVCVTWLYGPILPPVIHIHIQCGLDYRRMTDYSLEIWNWPEQCHLTLGEPQSIMLMRMWSKPVCRREVNVAFEQWDRDERKNWALLPISGSNSWACPGSPVVLDVFEIWAIPAVL